MTQFYYRRNCFVLFSRNSTKKFAIIGQKSYRKPLNPVPRKVYHLVISDEVLLLRQSCRTNYCCYVFVCFFKIVMLVFDKHFLNVRCTHSHVQDKTKYVGTLLSQTSKHLSSDMVTKPYRSPYIWYGDPGWWPSLIGHHIFDMVTKPHRSSYIGYTGHHRLYLIW